MTKFAVAAVLALGVFTAPAMAADLIVDQAPAVYDPAVVESGLYGQLLGGAALPGTLEQTLSRGDGKSDIEAGWAVAGVVGFGTGIDGLSVEGDAFYTKRDYEDREETLTTGALMAALKYTVSLNETFDVYGGIGLGGIFLHDESDIGNVVVDDWGVGYLVKAGVTAQIAQNVALVGEVRYMNSFSKIDGDQSDEQIGTTAVLGGIQIGF